MNILWIPLCCVLLQAVNGGVTDILTPAHDPSRGHTQQLSESTLFHVQKSMVAVYLVQDKIGKHFVETIKEYILSRLM